jgi:hypothetical protein
VLYVNDRAVEWLDRRAYGCDGALLGTIVNVYDSAATGGPAWLAIGMGVFGMHMAVVPVRGAVQWGADVVVAYDRTTILTAPPGDVYVTLEPDDESRLIAHYRSHQCRASHPSRSTDRKHPTT